MQDAEFQFDHAELGPFELRPLRVLEDMPVVHSWVNHEKASYWGMLGRSLPEVSEGYRAILKTARVFIGYHQQQPAFLVETYFPGDDPVGAHYQVAAGDRGMHVLLSPGVKPLHGFSWAVFSTVMEFLFSDPAVSRVVVEPDIGNVKIHALNRRAGFRYQKIIDLSHKTAHLAFCTREDYRAVRDQAPGPGLTAATGAEFEPDVWAAVNRALLCKAISEFAHERLLAPTLQNRQGELARYVLEAPGVVYRFCARILPLEHWDIELASLGKHASGSEARVDALEFMLEFREQLGIQPEMLPVYLEEIASTLYGAAQRRSRQRHSSHDLVHASFQEIESAMSEGHPTFVANSGRVGFDAGDYARYAPESGAPIRLIWLAARRSRAEFSSIDGLAYEALVTQELGQRALARLRAELAGRGLELSDYLLLPVHPWQWFNKLALTFAPDIAARDLVCLGYGEDEYCAQQSIRTLFNRSHPRKRYVKMALSVLNMGFLRGLSADYMRGTPAINAYLHELVSRDSFLQQKGFGILREVAGVGYRNPYFEAALPKSSAHRKMLAALWRESPLTRTSTGQRLMTMAALLHRDREGVALLPLLIRASGLSVDAWLTRYLDCYLAPLLHCLYAYELVFMPHGENVILGLENHVVVKAFMKDIAEEAAIFDPDRPLPALVQRIRVSVPDNVKLLSIFTDVFDGIFRYLSQILLEQADYPADRFWARVRACVLDYQAAHPEFEEKFRRLDPFAPEFLHSCLNRLQLRNSRQMLDLTDPAGSLQFAGTLRNPIAG